MHCISCNGQSGSNTVKTIENNFQKKIGGGCVGCEIMYIDMPANISSVDTSAGWTEQGQKLLITGKVYQIDGKTPAPNVIIYYWQTDNTGYYSPVPGMHDKAKRHGHIRGWVKTDENGNYAIYTIAAPYPGERMAAHIHTSINEPGLNEYYIDEWVFDDDKLLTSANRKRFENRGGSGILRPLHSNELQIAEHNIILGLNIPGYPAAKKDTIQSGLNIGEESPSFIPYHAWGPDKGKRTCPVCAYGRYHGVVYFVGDHPDWEDIKKWLAFLEKESVARSKYLKAYFVYGNSKEYSKDQRQKTLEALGSELNLKNIALTFVPSIADTESEVHLNKINPEVENTFIIYKHRTIVDKYINVQATDDNFKTILTALDKTKGNYFHLAEPRHE